MFFNIANLDTKLMVAILGQDCSLVIQPFSISHPFVLTHPCVKPSGTPLFLTVQSCFRRWPLQFRCCVPVPRSSLTQLLQFLLLLWNFACSLLSRLSNLPCSLIVDRSFQIHIAFASGYAPIHWKHSNVPTTSCRGLHHTQSHLLASPSRSTCSALSFSLRKECSHFSLPIYWRRVTAQTRTGLDTSGSVDHSSMNFVDQMPTRRSFTGSKISIQSWSKLATLNFICGVYCLANCFWGVSLPLSMTKLWTCTIPFFLYKLVKCRDLSFCGISWL